MKKRDKQLIKKDIFVYAEMMDKPLLREDKNYIIAGCYNEDKTKFENKTIKKKNGPQKRNAHR